MGLLACTVVSAQAQSRADAEVATVRENIQDGSTMDLARLFADDVNLSLNGEQAHYSRDQAEMVLKEYLRQHPIGRATVVREASPSDSLRYILARCTSQGRPCVRMELTLRKENGHFAINSMEMVPE